MAEVIEIQSNADNENWIPFVGDETNELLRSKGFANADRTLNANGQRVLDETYRIMQVCGNPNIATNSETGIVIGYVQSGKTLSFTTLTALARDNNYQIVIVIAGTSISLVNQSTNRLSVDLRLNVRYDRKWTLLQNPTTREDRETIETTLTQWADNTFPNERCRTILITVMKHGSHLGNLTNILDGLNLEGVPVLIIDDEGDQASLNTRARWAARQGIDVEDLTENDVSTIYRRITGLRAICPHHTFLQYTATPQANLFINIMDRLSPNFIKLLTPGQEYTGGIEFFRNNPNLIIEIPINEIPTPNNVLHDQPESLISALRIFFLGVVAGGLQNNHRNRTMLVHPSRLQGDHNQFTNWVRNTCNSWRRLLTGNDEQEKQELLNDFRISYNQLQTTVNDLPAFEVLTGSDLIHAIQYTPIVEVNSRRGATPQINWQDSYSWILVGGQSMDRGFTVEGLTVTYMPRNVGVGNVDTIQQRARFFGYKRSYLGYCRVFLDQVTIDAYNFIVEHEEDVRNRLEEFDVSNRHLNDWDREAVLDQMLNLTRANILYDGLDRDRFGDDWYRINAPHDTENLIQSNSTALFDFLNPKAVMFAEDDGHANRTQEQKHLVARIPMRECLEHLLNKLKYTRESDSATYSSLRGILKGYLDEHPDDDCLIYLMSANTLEDWTRRVRRLDRNDEIQQLFQGRNPRTGEVIYPGDSEIKNENLLTIQIHLLNIRDTDFASVPTLAIWIPEHIGRDIIRQA
ncbi:MAG: alpha-1,4 polygalactosaminidase [Sphingobacteriales bacterium]|nr:alpha-1,4 polygalactosaminidase [Sphingobacteriales bacterium]